MFCYLMNQQTYVFFWLRTCIVEFGSHVAITCLFQNLDIETIDALCDAINNFNGGIVVVTHDQRLIEECECTLWVVEKQGVTRWDAGFDDYKETILRELEEAVEKEAVIRREKLEATAKLKAEKMARLALLAKK
jgi:hypothetical protein